MYIGSSVNIKNRWKEHLCELKRGTHHCHALQYVANKYTINDLKFEKLIICSKNDLLFYEQKVLDEYWNDGVYNSLRNADNNAGMIHTEESRKKMSISRSGVPKRQEHIDNVVRSKRGAKLSTNKSGFVGVNFHKAANKYVAQISICGKKKHLGCFETAQEASEAYQNFLKTMTQGN